MLAAISAQFEAMTTEDPPGKGKSKVVSLQGHAASTVASLISEVAAVSSLRSNAEFIWKHYAQRARLRCTLLATAHNRNEQHRDDTCIQCRFRTRWMHAAANTPRTPPRTNNLVPVQPAPAFRHLATQNLEMQGLPVTLPVSLSACMLCHAVHHATLSACTLLTHTSILLLLAARP